MSDTKRRIAVNNPRDVPQGLSDDELIDYWDSHKITEEFLAKADDVPVEERPIPRDRTKPVSVRLDNHTLGRLKRLAEIRGIGYQTLLKDFVKERLYEEELREGVLPSSHRTMETVARTTPTSLAALRLGTDHVMAVRNPWRHLSASAPVLKKHFEYFLWTNILEGWSHITSSLAAPHKVRPIEGADAPYNIITRKMLENSAVVIRHQARYLAQSKRQRKAGAP